MTAEKVPETAAAPPTAVAQPVAAMPPAAVAPLGRLPSEHTCQYCGHKGMTRVQAKFGMCAIIALIVLLLTFWPLFFLPLIMPSCKDKKHHCQSCNRLVGENEGGCDTCCKSETN